MTREDGYTLTEMLVVIGIIGLFALGWANKDNVNDSDDVAVGDCVRIEKDSGTSIKPVKIDCGTSDFHWSVAAKVDVSSQCGESYDTVWFRGSGDDSKTLCLAREMQVGKCYEWPSVAGSLSDVREISCGSAPQSAFVAVKIDSRQSGPPNCDSGQQSLHYTRSPRAELLLDGDRRLGAGALR